MSYRIDLNHSYDEVINYPEYVSLGIFIGTIEQVPYFKYQGLTWILNACEDPYQTIANFIVNIEDLNLAIIQGVFNQVSVTKTDTDNYKVNNPEYEINIFVEYNTWYLETSNYESEASSLTELLTDFVSFIESMSKTYSFSKLV